MENRGTHAIHTDFGNHLKFPPSESSNLTISPPLRCSILPWILTHSFEAMASGGGVEFDREKKCGVDPRKGKFMSSAY